MPALLAALALAALQGGAPAAKTVTVKTGLETVAAALEAIGRATGETLRASPRLADLPLLVRVQDAPEADLLARIAETVGGEWRRDGEALVLSSDSALERKLAAAGDPKRIARLAAKLAGMERATEGLKFDETFAKKQREEGAKLFSGVFSGAGMESFDPGKIFASSLFTQSPATRAIAAILSKIGPAPLAGIRPGERVVLALNPTRAQGALPGGSDRIVRDFLAANVRLAAAMKSTAPNDGEFDMFSAMSGAMSGGTATAGGAVSGPDAMAYAHLDLNASDGAIVASLTAYDAEGKPIGSGFSIVDLPALPGKEATKPDEAPPLVYDALAAEWGAKYRAVAEGATSSQEGLAGLATLFAPGNADARNRALAKGLSPALRAFLADPSKRQPAEPLFAPIADAIPGNLVATVPDDGLLTLATLAADPKTTGPKALAALEASNAFSVARREGWTIVGASTPARLRASFADRGALRTLAAAVAKTGYPRLDDLAAYAVAQGRSGGALALGAPIVALIQGAAPFALATNPLVSEFDALRIWGSLSSEQRALLAGGRGVSYRALSPGASDALSRLLYDSRVGPTPEADDGTPNPMAIVGGLFGGGNRGEERTVRFPDGVPSEGFFTAKIVTSPAYRMTDSNSGATLFGGAEILGFVRGAKAIPFLASIAGNGEYDRFTPARTTDVSLRFVFGPKLAAVHTLQDQELGTGETVTYDRLPADFRAKAEELSKLAATMKGPPKPINP